MIWYINFLSSSSTIPHTFSSSLPGSGIQLQYTFVLINKQLLWDSVILLVPLLLLFLCLSNNCWVNTNSFNSVVLKPHQIKPDNEDYNGLVLEEKVRYKIISTYLISSLPEMLQLFSESLDSLKSHVSSSLAEVYKIASFFSDSPPRFDLLPSLIILTILH